MDKYDAEDPWVYVFQIANEDSPASYAIVSIESLDTESGLGPLTKFVNLKLIRSIEVAQKNTPRSERGIQMYLPRVSVGKEGEIHALTKFNKLRKELQTGDTLIKRSTSPMSQRTIRFSLC